MKGFEEYACLKQNFLGDDAKMAKFLSILPSDYKLLYFDFPT